MTDEMIKPKTAELSRIHGEKSSDTNLTIKERLLATENNIVVVSIHIGGVSEPERILRREVFIKQDFLDRFYKEDLLEVANENLHPQGGSNQPTSLCADGWRGRCFDPKEEKIIFHQIKKALDYYRVFFVFFKEF